MRRDLNRRQRRPLNAPLKITRWETQILREWEENGVKYNSHRHYFSITSADESAHIHTHDTIEDSGGGGYCGVGVNHDHSCTVNAGSAHGHVFSGYTGVTTANDLFHTHTISVTSQVGDAHQHNLPANWSSSFCSATGCEADPHLHVAGGANANESSHTHGLNGNTGNGTGLLRWHTHSVNVSSEAGSAHTHIVGTATISDVSCHTGYLHNHSGGVEESSAESTHVHNVLGDTDYEGEPVDGSQGLYAEFEVGQDAVDLKAAFDGQTSVELLGEFDVRHEASQDLKSEFRVKCPRRFGGNWQRKMWFNGVNYWRGRYCPTDDALKFEYITAAGLIGNVWTENVAARIDVSGFGGIIADFTVRGGQSGIPATIHYSDGVDSWVAESDEASITGWAWQNTTKVFDGTAPDYYRMVNICANRTTPTPRLWAVAVFYDQSSGKQWVKASRQSTGGDLTAWDAEVDVSNVDNTDTMYGCSVRSMGDAGLVKNDIMIVYKEDVAIRSRYFDGDWDDPIEDVDITTLPGKGAWDFEHGETLGENEGHIVYVDADGSVQWRERESGAAGTWSAAEELHGAIGSQRGVGIVQHGSGWLWVVWADDTIIEYRLHLCGPEIWYPLLVDGPLLFDSKDIPPAVVATTWLDGQLQTPDYISAGLAVPVCWVGQTGVGDPCEPGWGILREVAQANLFAEFTVRHEASVDLPAAFDGQASVRLLGEFTVLNVGAANLPAEFEVAQGDEDLLAGFLVLNVGSEDLAAGFVSQAVYNIPAEFVIRRSGLLNLPAEFVVLRGVEDLHGDFIARHAYDLDVKAEFLVGRVASVDLLGEFTVRQETSVDLPAGFEAQATENLLGTFIVRPEASADLRGIITVRHAYTGSEVIIAYEPSAFFNYSEDAGTGFLSHPQYGSDTKVKKEDAGQASLRSRINYAPDGYDYIQFGWRYRNPVWGEDTWPGTYKASASRPGEFVVRQEVSLDLHAQFEVKPAQAFNDLKAQFYVDMPLLPGGLWDYQYVYQNLAAEIEVGTLQGQIEVDPASGAITARTRHAINERTIVTMCGGYRAYSKGTFIFDAEASAYGGVNPLYAPAFGLVANKYDFFAGGSAHAALLYAVAGAWYFYTEDGGDTESTLIAGINFSAQHTFKIVWEDATEYPATGRVRLWIDDVLKATHTVAVPTDPLLFFLLMDTYIEAYSEDDVWTKLHSFSVTGDT